MRETSELIKPDEKSSGSLVKLEAQFRLNSALRTMIQERVPVSVENDVSQLFSGEPPETFDITDQQGIDAISEFEASSED